jgi:hypothetical protein
MRTQLSLRSTSLILAAGVAVVLGCSAEAAPVGGTGGGSSGSPGAGGGIVPGAGGGIVPGAGGGIVPGAGGGIVPGAGGGTSGSPGSGGGATTTDCNLSPASGGPPLIDDVQDADNAIEKMNSMRTGWWYTFDDCPPAGTGMCPPGMTSPPPDSTGVIALVPEADPENPMNYVIHTSGSGHTLWGSGLGVGLRAGTSNKCLFDASMFSGITFRIKGSGTVRLKLPIPATIDAADVSGLGACPSGPTCYDDFGIAITLGAAWAVKTYTWADLMQEGWGTMATFNPAQLTDIQWQVSSTAAAPASYDFYVDDLAFTP